MDDRRQELLEIYKLHAELADRVSHRRESANRLYVGLLTGLVLFVAALLRFGRASPTRRPRGWPDSISADTVLFWVGVLGVVLAISWYVVIRSHRRLNTGKFDALQELERHLAYPFFTKEWERLGEGGSWNRYWKLTVVETALPWIFFALFGALAIFAAFN